MTNNQINNNQKNTKNNKIHFNPDHSSNKNQSLEKEDVVNFFEKNRENASILAVFNVYSKLSSSNVDNIDISEQDVANVTNLAKNIFENFQKNNYQEIVDCNNQLIHHLKSEDSHIKNDAKFALKTYITYLVKCAKIKEEAKEDQSKSTLLEDNFNKVFSQDLKVCAGGITSAFENALSTGPKARIIEELIKKWVKILNIPDVMETHLRPFIIDMFDKKVEDTYKDVISSYFTRAELHNLISCIASGDFFDYIAQDIKDIYQELNKMPNNTINGYYNLEPAELMTKDHYLFIEGILDLYCFIDNKNINGDINEDDYQLIKSEEELLTKLKEKFLEKKLFKKNNDDYETQTKFQQLIELLTSSFKNKDLFFYSQLLSYKILDDNNKIIEENLDNLLNSSEGSARFKEFAKNRIISIAQEILNDNKYQKIIKKIKKLENNSNNKPNFSSEEIRLLIEGNASLEILTQAIENIENPQDIGFDINKLANNPKADDVIKLLKNKNISPKTTIIPNFENLIYNRNYAFLDILLSNYPDYFSVKEYFDFLNQNPNLGNNMPLKQKLAFIDWLDNKINNQNISRETKNNLIDIIKVNKYLLLEILENQPKNFKKYFEKLKKICKIVNNKKILNNFFNNKSSYSVCQKIMTNLLQKDPQNFFEIIILAIKNNDIKNMSLMLLSLIEKDNFFNPIERSHFVALAQNPQIFLETIKLLITKQENQSSALMLPKVLFQLIDIRDDFIFGPPNDLTPFHILANKNPQIFLETIKFLTTKQEGQSSPLITEKKLLELFDRRYDGFKPLDILARYNPETLIEVIKFLTIKQQDESLLISSKKLLELFNNKNNAGITILHFLANAKGAQQNFLETIKLLTTKQEVQASSLITGKQLFELLNKKDSTNITPLHYLAEKNPQNFFEVIKFLSEKISPKELNQLLNNKNIKNPSPLDILAKQNSQNFFNVIELLVKNNQLSKYMFPVDIVNKYPKDQIDNFANLINKLDTNNITEFLQNIYKNDVSNDKNCFKDFVCKISDCDDLKEKLETIDFNINDNKSFFSKLSFFQSNSFFSKLSFFQSNSGHNIKIADIITERNEKILSEKDGFEKGLTITEFKTKQFQEFPQNTIINPKCSQKNLGNNISTSK